MSICSRAVARKAVFNGDFTVAEKGDNGEVDYLMVGEFGVSATEGPGGAAEGPGGATGGPGGTSDDILVDAGDEDFLVSTVKQEYLQYRHGIKWDHLAYDVVREDGVPVEYICCNDPTTVVNQSPPFDPEFCDYFSHQQKASIRSMEKMELNNALIIESDFFDEKVLNNFAIGANFGMLSNDVGSGKTRIASAVAFRNLYSQAVGGNTLRKLPITTYREVIQVGGGNTQLFKQFFGAQELQYNPISNVNVNKLGNELEKGIRYKCLGATLMVVSPSTFHQWKQEVLDMQERLGGTQGDSQGDSQENLQGAPKFLFISAEEDFSTQDPIDDPDYAGKVARVKEQLDDIDSDSNSIIVMTNKWYNDNLITSPRFFSFNRIFFDEPDTIEYKSSNKIVARFTWLISTTIKQWIQSRYDAIKGTEALAGRDKATRVGEVEVCTYDDPSIVEIILNNFLVRDTSSPVDNSNLLDFVKYSVFADNFYNAFGVVLADYSSLTEALSAYDVPALEKVLGTEKACVMDKIYRFIEGKHATNAEVTSLELKFGEQTKYAQSQPAGTPFAIDSANYLALEAAHAEKKREMLASIASRDAIFWELDKILISSTKEAKCTICKESVVLGVTTGDHHVSDCCFSITHTKCIEDVKAAAAPAAKATVRRRRKQETAPVAAPVVQVPVATAAEGVGNNSLFKDIMFSSGKVFTAGPNVGQVVVETVEKGNKVSTKGLFDIDRTVIQEEYSAFEDMFSEKEAERFDCRCCGVVGSKIHPLEKSLVFSRMSNPVAITAAAVYQGTIGSGAGSGSGSGAGSGSGSDTGTRQAKIV